MRVAWVALLGAFLLPAFLPIGAATSGESSSADLAAARALFERNLQAIREHDRAAYLSCYLDSPRLVRTGLQGMQLGFEGLAAGTSEGWPDHFQGRDLRLVPVREGVVYGSYRYRVRYGGEVQSGISERLFVETPEGWKIAVTTAFPALPGVPPPPLALVGATLIDGTGAPPLENAVVVVRGGEIVCADTSAECQVPEGIEVRDLSGRWITPGLIDTHVHLSQSGWADGRPDFIDVRERFPYAQVVADLAAHPERFFRSFLCSGVTAVFDVGGYSWTWRLREETETDTLAPHLAAAGPLLSTIDFWLNLPASRQFVFMADAAAVRRAIRAHAARGSDAVKVWFIPTEERPFSELAELVRLAGEEAERAGLPLIVHATGVREARVAVEAGAHLLVHSVVDGPLPDSLVATMAERGVFYAPTLTVFSGYQKLAEAVVADRVPTIDNPNGCVSSHVRQLLAQTPEISAAGLAAGLEARQRRIQAMQEVAAANLRRLADAGVPIVLGTDAGNPLTLHGPSVYAELEAMQAAGMPPEEVLLAATRNGARALGREELGTLETGKAADLLVLAADPTQDIVALRQLEAVMRGGVLRSIKELSALASQ